MEKIEAIKHFQNICKCKKFLLTGSSVLHLHRLTNPTKDIDISLIEPSEETVEMLKRLQQETMEPGFGNFLNYQGEEVIMLKFDDYKFDFFIEHSTPLPTYFKYDGIECKPIQDIITAKKKLSRPKDCVQLQALSKKIYSEKDLQNYLERF